MTNNKTNNAKKREIQDLYRSIHIGRQEEDFDELTKQARDYLSRVKFKTKFSLVPVDAYLKEVILRKDNKKPETFLQIRKGFSNLEKYGIKLLKAPWRKEFQTVKLYSSFFKHEIEPSIPVVFASGILQLYGYKHEESQDILKLDEAISLDFVFKTAFELFLATIELQVMLEIAKEIELYTDIITLSEILDARVNTIGDVIEVRDLLFKVKSISPEHKRIKMDPPSERKKTKSATIENCSDIIPSIRFRNSPTSTTSRHHKAISTKVTHISSTKGDGSPVNGELYGDVEGLSDADLYGVNGSPSYTHHYPQVTGNNEGESDYIDMAGTSEVECYEFMAPQVKNSNGHFELPPPTYNEALHIQNPENFTKDWVVIPSPPRHSNNDVGCTIPGMSGLTILENSTSYHDNEKMIRNGLALSGSKLQTQRKVEELYAEQVQLDDRVLPAISSQVKTPSYGTASDASSNKKTEQKTARVSDKKLQTSSNKANKNEISSQRSKRTGNSKSARVEVNSESSSCKPRYDSPIKVMLPTSTIPPTEPQKSSHTVDVKPKAALWGKDCTYCLREATHMCIHCFILCCERCQSSISSAHCSGKYVHRLIDKSGILNSEDKLTGEKCIQCGRPSGYECSSCNRNLCSDCYSMKASRTGRCISSVGHNFRPVTSINKDQRREETSIDNDLQEQKRNCDYCGKEATNECQFCKKKSCNVCKHIKKSGDPCKSSVGHMFKEIVSNKLTDETQIQIDLNASNICEFCGLIANFICADCHILICKQCQHIYKRDHCPATKRDHFFHVITSQTKIEPKEVPWQCGRCTFSNPPQNKICTMCATSKGVTSIDLPEIGSRRCAHCTFGNSEDAKICVMCSRSLSQSQIESYI